MDTESLKTRIDLQFLPQLARSKPIGSRLRAISTVLGKLEVLSNNSKENIAIDTSNLNNLANIISERLVTELTSWLVDSIDINFELDGFDGDIIETCRYGIIKVFDSLSL
ncbi:MAG: hypothetical protein MHPSP_000213, partial [Paramarteilia canceri]